MALEYLGRVIVDMNTEDSAPAAAFGVMVRTPAFKARKFYDRGDRLYMGPLVEGSEPHTENAENIFYNTMLCKGDTLIVTNGQHTDARSYREKQSKPSFEEDFWPRSATSSAERIMLAWGPKQDTMDTPRIALVSYPNFSRTLSLFAIASKCDNGIAAGAVTHQPGETPRGLSTYRIAGGKPAARSVANSGEIYSNLIDVPIGGSSAQEIADSLFAQMHPDLVVASAAAVFRDGRWQVAFRNRFETPEDLEEFKATRGLQ